MGQNFDLRVSINSKSREHFYGRFHRPLALLIHHQTLLSSAVQLYRLKKDIISFVLSVYWMKTKWTLVWIPNLKIKIGDSTSQLLLYANCPAARFRCAFSHVCCVCSIIGWNSFLEVNSSFYIVTIIFYIVTITQWSLSVLSNPQ